MSSRNRNMISGNRRGVKETCNYASTFDRYSVTSYEKFFSENLEISTSPQKFSRMYIDARSVSKSAAGSLLRPKWISCSFVCIFERETQPRALALAAICVRACKVSRVRDKQRQVSREINKIKKQNYPKRPGKKKKWSRVQILREHGG